MLAYAYEQHVDERDEPLGHEQRQREELRRISPTKSIRIEESGRSSGLALRVGTPGDATLKAVSPASIAQIDVGPNDLRSDDLQHPRHQASSQNSPETYGQPNRPTSKGIVDAFVKVCQRWSLGDHDRAVLLGLDADTSLASLIARGDVRPVFRDMLDRMAYVVSISIGLGEVFEDDREGELHWLGLPRPELGGESALQHMLEGSMKRLMTVHDLVLEFRGL